MKRSHSTSNGKECSRKEDCMVFENVCFTQIVLQEFLKTPFPETIPALLLIAHQNDLMIFPSENGLHYNQRDLNIGCRILERSIQFN